MYDEPLALPAQAREHLAACAHCRARYDEIAAQARASANLLAVADATVDTERARARVRARIADERPGAAPVAVMPGSGSARRPVAAAAALLAAAVLAGSLILTPVGSLAQSFITIFEPKSFTPVNVSTGDMLDLRNLPNLGAFGTMHVPDVQLQPAADRSAAAAATGLAVQAPAELPSGVPAAVRYMVLRPATASFTFSAAKAATALTRGTSLPPMPRQLDGSTLAVTAGPAVAAVYGGTIGQSSSSTSDVLSSLPTLVVAQAAMPRVGSTGASVATIESYLLRLPGITPHLAQEIRSIGDPTSTLPIPIPLDFANAHAVQVQGVRGLAVGDQTGLGSGVIWQRDGEMYGVAGTLPESQVLAIANSLR
jgi:hypothetical protein